MKFFNKINKAIATTVLSTGIITSAVTGVSLLNARDYTVYASPYGEQTISKITDNDFHNYSGTIYGSPSNWTVTSDSDTANSERFVSGIMNLTSSTAWNSNYEDNFKLEESQNPDDGSTTDKQFLYINNFSSTLVKYGYKSDSFDLSKNSFYSISVQLKTLVNKGQSAKASIYITGFENDVKMENVYTDGNWQFYTFYIATNSISSSSGLNLEVWLGSKDDGSYGAMFVNKVEVKQYDESTFNSISNKDSSTSTYTNLNKNVSIPFSNNGFESDLTGWTLSTDNSNDSENQYINSVKVGTGFNSSITTNWNAKNPYTINSFNNEYALLISNKKNLISGVESPAISIKQHGLYKLSVWAYSDCSTGNGATIIVKEIGAVGNDLAYTNLSVSTETNSSEVTSNWCEYSVYIQGNSFKDTTVKLGLYLGVPAIGNSSASPTSGYVYFDEVRIQEISYTEYQNGINDTTYSAELNITPNTSSFTVLNNRFNKAKNEDSTVTYPLAPQNFIKSTKDINGYDTDATTTSGIVNLNLVHWNKNSNNYGSANHPGVFNSDTIETTTNNVLMIGSTNPIIKQAYTSDSFTLEPSSYYKVSVWVQTQIYPQYNGGASIKLLNNSKYIYKNEKINTQDTWQQITFFIKTGSSELNSSFELALDQAPGFAFFDELFVQKYSSETIFNANVTSSDKVIDLTYENFDTENTYNGYFDSSVTNQSAKDNLTSGITDLNGNNVLYIKSNGSDVYYSFTNSKTYSLTSGNYYKISVDVYTLNLNQEEENTKYDDDDKVIPFGASLELKNSAGTFVKSITGINTATVNQGENDFTTYSFYICASENIEAYLYLSLGYTDALTCGTVYFDNIKFDSSLTEEQFNAAKNDYSNEQTSLFVNDTNSTEINDTTDPDTDKDENEPYEFPWILVSGLITGLAIIIAIVGYFIRKINFRRAPKIKTSYDRRKTLDVELDRRERIKLRQSMIEELKLQLHTIDDEIAAIKEMFDAKEAQILINEKVKREKITADKKAIVSERENATKEYKSILASDATDKEKQLAERNFARYISKLNKQEEQLQKLLDKRETASALLKIKREQQLQRYIDAQIAIAKEIERIEQEIEQIAKEDEQVWAEYKAAKLDAKQRKTAYIQEKKVEKAQEKQNKKSKKSEDKTSSDENN